MQRKQLVKRNGEWVEEYVDCGPSHALPGHGNVIAGAVARAPLGTARGRRRSTVSTDTHRNDDNR